MNAYERYTNLLQTIDKQGENKFFESPEEMEDTFYAFAIAMTNCSTAAITGSLGAAIPELHGAGKMDVAREAAVKQILHINSICEECGAEPIFSGDTSDPEAVDRFVKEFTSAAYQSGIH